MTRLARNRDIGLALGFCVMFVSSLTAQVTPFPEIPSCVEPTFKYPDNMVRPRYPKQDLQAGTDTSVELRIVVAPDGKITELLPHMGNNSFVNAAVHAVRKWRFYPTEVDGRAVETAYKVVIHFNSVLQEAVPSGIDLQSPHPSPSPAVSEAATRMAREYEAETGEQVHRLSEKGLVPPRETNSPEPELSEVSRKKGERGIVTTALVVDRDGSPRNVSVVCSSIPDSDQNAVDAMRQWKFSPGTMDGKPVAVAITVETSFKLN